MANFIIVVTVIHYLISSKVSPVWSHITIHSKDKQLACVAYSRASTAEAAFKRRGYSTPISILQNNTTLKTKKLSQNKRWLQWFKCRFDVFQFPVDRKDSHKPVFLLTKGAVCKVIIEKYFRTGEQGNNFWASSCLESPQTYKSVFIVQVYRLIILGLCGAIKLLIDNI